MSDDATKAIQDYLRTICPPAPTKCKVCGSLYCGPIRCRFEDRTFINEEVDERLEDLREHDRHPERYR